MTMNEPFLIAFEKMGSPEIGFLTVAQYGEYLPFEIKRVFWNYQVPEGVERGNHAYRTTQQVLVVLHGRVEVKLESVEGRQTQFLLRHPHEGLLVPPLCWRKVQFYDQAIMAVFSSNEFDPDDHLRDYETFRQMS
jgi:hypothetical protein